MSLLENKCVFVTGGSRGIGRAICETFAGEGADIAFNYNSDDAAAGQVRAAIEAHGVRCLGFKASVNEVGAVRDMFKETQAAFGRLDVLVNNAGIKRDGFFMTMSDDHWNDVISTNLKGVFYCSREAAKLMMRRKTGAIVNITSLTGVMGQPGQANYAASKAGVIGFSKSIAKELARYNIRVNCVAPGFVETDMLTDVPEQVLADNRSVVPLARFGTSGEVADVALFLASDLSSYVTGDVINVNGGLYM